MQFLQGVYLVSFANYQMGLDVIEFSFKNCKIDLIPGFIIT